MKQNSLTGRKDYSLIAPLKELPTLVTRCPRCGGEIELWSEDDETVCLFCNQKIFPKETTTH